MTQGDGETLKQAGADRQPQVRQALGTAAYTVDELLETALLRLLDDLAVDQLRVGLLERLLGASRLARARKGLQGMVDLDQRREVTTEAVTEKAGDAQDHGGRHLDELQGTLIGPGANKRRKDEPVFRGETDPDPLPPVLAQGGALPIRASRRGMFALDEAPHLMNLAPSGRTLLISDVPDASPTTSSHPQVCQREL